MIVLKLIEAEQGTSAFKLGVSSSPTFPYRMSNSKSHHNNPAMSTREIALRACDYSDFTHSKLPVYEDGFEYLSIVWWLGKWGISCGMNMIGETPEGEV
jgi:hypothetical protein